ncbi:MAG: hypothetical protein LC104_09660 [Bacteroidales bacterium]|nr:hypothetical protein [Bacteroidales bacterium]
MPIAADLLTQVTTAPPQEAWQAITAYLWEQFSAPIAPAAADAEVVRRDKDLNELDNVISGSAWELWSHFEACIPKASDSLVSFWGSNPDGRAILILDGLSLRETPWLLTEAERRGYKIRDAGCRGSELPAETTPFAKSLGFSQRSALDNNGAGAAHKLKGATTANCDLNWLDCVNLVGSQTGFAFWHHWPDARMHDLSGPGASLHKLAKETYQKLTSDDFWALVERLTTGRRLVITSDHGYAACGHFHDIVDKDQSGYMKTVFKSGRSADPSSKDGSWVPPIDMKLTTASGTHQLVLGRRKWKSAAGYPTLQHGGLSLLEVFVPYIELAR